MTNQEWKRRCVIRILREVRKAGRLRIRELKQRTHYNRGPQDESIGLWYDALEGLARAGRIRLELDEFDNPMFAQVIEPKQVNTATVPRVATDVATDVATGI